MVWDPAEAEWQDNLAAARVYMGRYGTLAAPRSAVVAEPGGQAVRALDGPSGAAGRPVGQWLSNCRRPGALSPERAAQLAEIDPDWCPDWPIDWQRHYAGVRALIVDGGAAADEITPGVTVHGADIGRWLQRQRETWAELTEAQHERLTALGVTAPEPEPAAAPKTDSRTAAWERGVTAARAYLAREGTLTGVSRAHVERVTHEDQEHTVKLGVWLANQRSRRAALPADRAAVLTELGVI